MFEIELIIWIKMDLALDNLQKLICHKTQPTNHLLCAIFALQLRWLWTTPNENCCTNEHISFTRWQHFTKNEKWRDFMMTHLWLFHAQRLENHVYSTFIFLCSYFLWVFFLHTIIRYWVFPSTEKRVAPSSPPCCSSY